MGNFKGQCHQQGKAQSDGRNSNGEGILKQAPVGQWPKRRVATGVFTSHLAFVWGRCIFTGDNIRTGKAHHEDC